MLAKALIENVSDAVVIIDDDTKIVGVNDAACDLFRSSRDELIGKLPQEIVAEPNPFRIEKFGSRLADRNTIEGKIPLLLEDGRVSQIEYKAFASVEPNRHLVIFRDISGQKRAEKQTEAFLKLGRLLSAAVTADAAAQIIAAVSDELFGWDACFFDLYIPQTDTVDPLLTVDIIDGERQNVFPRVAGSPSPIGRKTMEEGKQLIFFEEDETPKGLIPFGDEERLSASLMFVPVRDGDQVIGVFSIQSYTQYAYTYEDLDTLQALADYCGGAFHRIRGEALLARSNYRLVTIREIEQAILEARSPVEIAETALHRIKDIIAYDRGSIILLDQSNGNAQSLVVTGFGSDDTSLTERILEQLPQEFFDLVVRNDYWIVDDFKQDLKFDFFHFLAEKGLRSVISVPLIAGKVLFGMLNLASTQPNAFKQEDAEVAGEVGTSLVVALQNANLLEAAETQAEKLSELVDETRRRAEQMEVMVNMSAALRNTQSRQKLIPIILDRLMDLSGSAGAAIALNHGENLVFELSLGQWPQLQSLSYPADQGISGRVFSTGIIFVSDSLAEEDEFLGSGRLQENFAAICLPLGSEKNSLGVIWLVRHESFSLAERRVMTAVADIVANALRRALLYEQVQAQARQVQQIVDTIPEGMLLLNEDWEIVLANPVAQTYLSQLAGVSIGDRLSELSGRPLDELLRPIMAGENWHELEYEKTGQIFELAVQQTYGRLEGGWVLVIRDVTEERNQARYFQIQERLAVVGQLAAGIAHDFNNIMSVIILYSTMLGHNKNLTPKEKERLLVIHKQAERASELIRQILDFSRQSVMKRSALNLSPFLKELVHLLERTLPETIHLSLETDPGDLIIQGDPTRLQQAIMNLAVNARDAMPGGGVLTITLFRKFVRVGDVPPLPDMAPGDWFELKVADTGTGIKSHHLPHLFEPFFTTKREGEGTGLGLAQVYGIVKQHDGYIDVSSRLNLGTTFFIYLPGVQMPRVEDASPEDAPLAEGMGQTILVVEDDTSARRALAEVLEMMDYKVITAKNGREALDLFDDSNGSIDLVLSDIVMPRMGGAALYTQLKKRRPDIKMVVMTGYPKKEEDWDLLEDGMVYWVQKPFQVSTIVETIRLALLDERAVSGDKQAGFSES